jgi:outer membrane biosynthesis protein TonB
MKRSVMLAAGAAAVVIVALTGVAARAYADSSGDIVAATSPLSIPASYHPAHYLKIATTGAGGVTLVKPAQAIQLAARVAPTATHSVAVGSLTAPSAPAFAAANQPATAKKHTVHKAHKVHKPSVTKHSAPKKSSHPSQPVHKSHPAPKPKPKHVVKPKPASKPMTPFLTWLFSQMHRHHHG